MIKRITSQSNLKPRDLSDLEFVCISGLSIP